MAKASLRAVKPDEKAPPRKPLSLVDAVEKGDPLDIALAQRREIVTSIGAEKGPALAALHRQLTIITDKITELQAAAEAEEADRPAEPGLVDDTFDASAL